MFDLEGVIRERRSTRMFLPQKRYLGSYWMKR